MVKAGDKLPTATFYENSPGEKVESADIYKGKNIIVGVPGAFTSACSARHAPGYIKNAQKFREKGIDGIYIVAVNDAFVTAAWADNLNAPAANVRILSDPRAEFAKAIDAAFDATPVLGNERSVRYALIVEDGDVKKAFVEPDKTSVTVSEWDKVYAEL